MSVSVNETMPAATFQVVSGQNIQELSVEDYFEGRKVALFGLPGAFTPMSHKQHVPELLALVSAFKKQGFDRVAVTCTNDAYMMEAWARSLGADIAIDFLADANGDFAKAMGVDFQASDRGMGPVRSKRYAVAVDGGVVTHLCVEDDPFKANASSAANFLAHVSDRTGQTESGKVIQFPRRGASKSRAPNVAAELLPFRIGA